MKTGDLVKQFGVNPKTINRWVDEFGKHFSDSAKAVGSRYSIFNEHDFRVVATIHQLSGEGHSYIEIHKRLDDGFLVEDISAATVGYSDGRMVPAAAVEHMIDASEVRLELERVKSDRDNLVQLLEKSYSELEKSRSENIELRDQISRLQRELGKLEGRLEEIDKRQ